MERMKYPRTMHLPWSKKAQDDDRVLSTVEHFFGHEVVVTEKLDGENFTIYPDGAMHARSVNYNPHISHDRVKEQLACVQWGIPQGWRVVGENVRAVHTMSYEQVALYPYYVFAVFNENNDCLSWDEIVAFCEELSLKTPPVLWRGQFDEKAIKACYTSSSQLGGEQEGYVVRKVETSAYEDFQFHVAKYVRHDFGRLLNERSEGRHWRAGEITFHASENRGA